MRRCAEREVQGRAAETVILGGGAGGAGSESGAALSDGEQQGEAGNAQEALHGSVPRAIAVLAVGGLPVRGHGVAPWAFREFGTLHGRGVGERIAARSRGASDLWQD